MKKKKEFIKFPGLFAFGLCCVLGMSSVAKADTVINAQPATTEATTQESTQDSTQEDKPTIIQGWNSKKNSYYENGVAVKGMKEIDGKRYYFNEKGKLYKKKGMRKINGKYYYFSKEHTIESGVKKVKGKYYYFQKKNGRRYEKTGMKKVDNTYYYFASNHSLKSGWYRNSKAKRYYFDKKDFAAKTGWAYIGKYKYYFEKNGQLCQDLRTKLAKKIRKQKGNNEAYRIMVNRTASCVTVYAKDGDNGYIIPVVAFVCSAGDATPTGTFHIRDKLRWHELMGPSWGQWCEHLTDDILFHSVFYNQKNDNRSLSVSAYNKLGTIASHGCIRLTAGDSKWIYDNCAVGTSVTIYNKKRDPGPFDKPRAKKLSSNHTWDPTDPTID